MAYRLLVANFENSLSETFNNFTIFYINLCQTTVTEICEKSQVVSSDFSMIKNIKVELSSSSLSTNKINLLFF